MPNYLEKRRRGWYAVYYIPAAVQPLFGGKRKFRKSLGTDSQSEAERRVGPVIATWKSAVARARDEDPLERDLEFWRSALADAGLDDEQREVTLEAMVDHAEKLEKRHGYDKAKLWYDRASGQRVDLKQTADEWLASLECEEKGKKMHRQVLRLLFEHHTTPDTVDRKAAANFVRDVLAPNRASSTVNRMLSTCSTLWDWMKRQGLREGDNPWHLQRLATSGRRGTDKKARRGFTDAEAVAILKAVDAQAAKYPADPLTVRIMAVTGMRIEEVCSLAARDVTKDPQRPSVMWLKVREGKSRAAVRSVPIVAPEVVTLLSSRLSRGPSGPDVQLFPEYPPNQLGDRYNALSKRLGRILKKVSKDPQLVPAHSWRHRARSELERAGIRPAVADTFIGHERPGMGLGNYYKPEDWELIPAAEALPIPSIKRVTDAA